MWWEHKRWRKLMKWYFLGKSLSSKHFQFCTVHWRDKSVPVLRWCQYDSSLSSRRQCSYRCVFFLLRNQKMLKGGISLMFRMTQTHICNIFCFKCHKDNCTYTVSFFFLIYTCCMIFQSFFRSHIVWHPSYTIDLAANEAHMLHNGKHL